MYQQSEYPPIEFSNTQRGIATQGEKHVKAHRIKSFITLCCKNLCVNVSSLS